MLFLITPCQRNETFCQLDYLFHDSMLLKVWFTDPYWSKNYLQVCNEISADIESEPHLEVFVEIGEGHLTSLKLIKNCDLYIAYLSHFIFAGNSFLLYFMSFSL